MEHISNVHPKVWQIIKILPKKNFPLVNGCTHDNLENARALTKLIKDLEEALLTDGTEEPSWLQELIVLLLKGCLQEHDISLFNYQMFLRRLFRKKCKEYEIVNPFNTDIDFELLPLRVKVEILYNLCEFRLDAPDVLDELKNLEADSLRVEPIGYDGKKSAYWYFYGTRLYREDLPKSEKPIWQVVCFTITDWTQLAKKFQDTKIKAEQSLYKTLKRNFIPELPRLFLEKETLARQRLLESKRSTKDESLLIREDYYTDVIRKEIQRREICKRPEIKSIELFDKSSSSESRYEMGKTKDKKHKQKDGTADRAVPPSTKSKDAKPVGRQTNNSLASATGQILIEPVSNPHKKKMKTSQVFSQSEEDLQTGLHKILDAVKDHEDAWPFINPVEEEYAPNYYSIIRKPMDLQKMEERLENGHYKTFSRFRTDFQLIVNNCKLYNGVENEYSEMVDTVLEFFNRSVERYLDQVTSSDDEIAVEFPDLDQIKRKKHVVETPAKKKSIVQEQTDTKKAKSKFVESDDEDKMYKKKKDKEEKKDKVKEDKKEKEKKDKIKLDKKEKEKEKENKRVKDEYREIMSPKKAKKRKSDVLEDRKAKGTEREAKIRKQDIKEDKGKTKHEEKNRKSEKDKVKVKKSKDVESKANKQDRHQSPSPKRHNSKKIESKESKIKDKRGRKPMKKVKRSSDRRSRSRSRSFSRSISFSSSRSRSPPSSPKSMNPEIRKHSPSKHKKLQVPNDGVPDKVKPKQDKWKEIFKNDKTNIVKNDSAKPKDKHHTLSETIEKLKAKSDLTKLKADKDLKIYDFPHEPKDTRLDTKKEAAVKSGKKNETIVHPKKKKMSKDLFDDDNSTADSVQSDKKAKPKKQTTNATNNSKKFDALSLATEQTLKDINKWLDDTPKFEEFSSATNSPSAFSGIDDFDNSTTSKSSDVEKKKIDAPPVARKDTTAPADAMVHSNNGNSNSSTSNVNSNMKKRPMNRDPTKMFRRKEVQRTIDRLQPGKSKGNLITNVQNKDAKQEEIFPLGSLSKIKDTKNSLIVKTDDSAPKLSLGSVLDSFGKHKFIDDDNKKDDESQSDKAADDKTPVDDNKEKDVKSEDVKVDSPKLDNSPGNATPNLSAWFKAFGGPKVQSVAKKADAKEEKTITIDNSVMEGKKEETRKVALPDPSPNPESPLMSEQPAPRQRKVSTGSSMSERSSFSQDMDSPHVGIDERIGAYPAPYPSPLHKSPAESPSLRSPLPDASPKSSTYPFNGQMRVGFYQDTVSTKSSPDKSCSPRDNPQSPYTQFSEHVYTPPTTQNANYSYNNPYYPTGGNYSSSNPTPPYNADSNAPSYYDTTKPLTDQYQAKNPISPAAQQPQSQQPSPHMSQQVSPNTQSQPSPIDIQHYQQHSPHSPLVNQQVQDPYAQSESLSPLQHQQQSPLQQQVHQPTQVQTQHQAQGAVSVPQLSHSNATQQQALPPQQTHSSQLSLSTQQVDLTSQQDKFMYGAQAILPQASPQQLSQLDSSNAYRATLEYGRQQAPPNVEPFKGSEPKLQQSSNSYPVKKRAYNEVEPSSQRSYDDSQNYPLRDPPKYIHQNIPELRIPSQVHTPQQVSQVPQQQNAVNQFGQSTYNYSAESGHQYPSLNIPSAGKMDMSKYTNMGYTGPDINMLSRSHHYKQPVVTAPNQTSESLQQQQQPPQQQQQQRFREQNSINMNNYKSPIPGLGAQSVPSQSADQANSFKPDVPISRPPTYHSTSGQMDIDQSLSLRGLSHIVDRYPNEESRILGLQGNPPPAYYSEKNLPPQHMFAGKPTVTSTPTLPMFSQSSSMPPYGVQSHANMYNRQMTDLQVPMVQSQTVLQQTQPQPQAPPPQAAAAAEPKPKKKRLTKAAKAAAAAAAAQAAQQQQTANPATNTEPSPVPGVPGQGFQTYAGLKTSTPSMEPTAISLKTTSVVPGSAFNFGPSTTGLGLPPGLYGEKDSYPNFLEDFRSAPSNYYMAAAAAAHHRATPEGQEKTATSTGRVPAHQASNPPGVSATSTATYPFIGAPQARPPSYPLAGVPGSFISPHQAPLMDTSSPQYLQYLQAGVLHQGLLPPGAYAAPGYHPALSIRQQYDSMTRPPWL